MKDILIEILDKIESQGFEAYVVGGYVRDYLLGIESTDIDICTNAKVVDLMKLLEKWSPSSDNYGAVKLLYKGYKIDITTYRKELKYNGDRKSLEVEYVDNLVEDVMRRDFTCNTLCMSKNGQIIDLLNGKSDIEDRLIRCVGDIDTKLQEDPLRILRAIRFASVLDFKIESDLFFALKKYRKLVGDLSLTRIKEELTKILVNKNALTGLNYLRRLGLLEYVGINYDKIVNVPDVCGMYSQLELIKEYPFSKEERENIKNIKEIVKYGKIDNEMLFKYGLYICLVAGEILGISKEEITELNKKLQIADIKDINITSDEICSILDIKPGKEVGYIYNKLKDLILNNELVNEKEDIKKVLFDQGKKWLNEGEYKKGFTF